MGGEQRGLDLAKSQKSGILPRALDFIFHEKDQSARVLVSFFEIYNEKVFDLLDSPQPAKQKRSLSRGRPQQQREVAKQSSGLEIREEKDHFWIPCLQRREVRSLRDAYEWLDRGLQRRATSSTSLNNQSSRSHSIFQITLERQTEEGAIVRSKLRIVDLAGSEKYTIRKDLPVAEKNAKVQELTSINSSLSALGQCISALSDAGRKHIPYRNSKLTKVLKDSLDESANVALIICISPSVDSYKETLSTL